MLKRGLNNDSKGKNSQCKNPNFRIIYCTRTHSQIKEFISEIKKTAFSKKFKVVHLASKTHYCLQDDVKAIKNSLVIEEKCQDKRKNGGCGFYRYIPLYNSKKKIYVKYIVLQSNLRRRKKMTSRIF